MEINGMEIHVSSLVQTKNWTTYVVQILIQACETKTNPHIKLLITYAMITTSLH